jgi:NAD(P)-dependent dehydrogenase (short-subunit alcohol dehydrogenase family)
MPKWTASNIPDQTGRTVIVTGATSGLGYETALALAGKGANVTLAVRDTARGETARARIVASYPNAKVTVEDLDLADLANVRAFAARWQGRPLDVLINNAGIMAVPYATTKDGFESQMGTNLLGHFVLTDGLLDSLLATTAPRVVTVSSMVHKNGRLETGSAAELIAKPDNYKTWTVYSNSKLADLLFALELNRRAQQVHSPLISVGAHPGYAATNLQGGPGKVGGLRGTMSDLFMKVGNAVLGQSAANGALPQLYAATMPDVVGGEYFGPDGPAEQRGGPKRVNPSKRALDPDLAHKVWATTVELTGADFSELGA